MTRANKVRCLIIASAMLWAVGCGNKQDNDQDASMANVDEIIETTTESSEEPTLPSSEEPVPEITLNDLEGYGFSYYSGVGAWSDDFEIYPDGTFSGGSHDSDMGVTGEGFPNGTRYVCNYDGILGTLERIDDYTYDIYVEDLTIRQAKDTFTIYDGVKYVYTEPFGLSIKSRLVIYAPGCLIENIPEEVSDFLIGNGSLKKYDTELACFVLYCEETGSVYHTNKVVDDTIPEELIEVSKAMEEATRNTK